MRNSCMVSSVVVVAFELADGEQQQQQQCRVASRRRSNCARPLVCVCVCLPVCAAATLGATVRAHVAMLVNIVRMVVGSRVRRGRSVLCCSSS